MYKYVLKNILKNKNILFDEFFAVTRPGAGNAQTTNV